MKLKSLIFSMSIIVLLIGIWYIDYIQYGSYIKKKVEENNNQECIVNMDTNKKEKIKRKISSSTKNEKEYSKFQNHKGNNIRVVIKNKNYRGIKHKSLKISSDDNMVITYGDNKNIVCGKKLNIKSECEYFKENKKIYINVVNKNNGIRLDSIKRAVPNNQYYGTIEVIKEGKNLIVVNEINVEQYLYCVVPSEMPESFGYEALKVQAICARTYAYTHMNNTVYKKYNAHVDDSVSYQVYNNHKYGEETKKAVDDTKGIVLTYNNQLAKVFYYSTSCGYSCGTKDVFGGYNVEYLKSKRQTLNKNNNVNKEEDFEKFILSIGGDCFEKNCEWFRWEIKWNVDKLSNAINNNLKKVSGVRKNNYVKVYKNGEYRTVPVSNIGRIKSISVNKRGQGGIVKEIIIKGTRKNIKINSQNVIRQILGPINTSIKKNSNAKVKGMEMLPSAYFVTKRTGENFIIYGGGFGHGVGMSQWGVFQLTKLGKKYEEIIEYYFTDVSLRIIDE